MKGERGNQGKMQAIHVLTANALVQQTTCSLAASACKSQKEARFHANTLDLHLLDVNSRALAPGGENGRPRQKGGKL